MYGPALHSHGIAFEVYAVDIAYNTKRFPTGSHPKTWAELWDLKRFPGRRTGPGWTPRDNFEAAVMAAGVPPAKVYPIDTKLAFSKLADIKPQMTWWQSGAQFAQFFADEEVQLGYGWGARVVVLAREGKPLAVEVNQAILDQTFYALAKISKRSDAAIKVIAFAWPDKAQAVRRLAPDGEGPHPLMFAIKAGSRRRRVRCGTGVLVLPFYHPLRLAGEIAVADVLTGGRLDIGVGRGAYPYEFARYGIPFDEGRARTQESLEILLRAWKADDLAHTRRLYPVPAHPPVPRPVP